MDTKTLIFIAASLFLGALFIDFLFRRYVAKLLLKSSKEGKGNNFFDAIKESIKITFSSLLYTQAAIIFLHFFSEELISYENENLLKEILIITPISFFAFVFSSKLIKKRLAITESIPSSFLAFILRQFIKLLHYFVVAVILYHIFLILSVRYQSIEEFTEGYIGNTTVLYFIIFSAAFLDYRVRALTKRFNDFVAKTKNFIDDAFGYASQKTISLFIWSLALYYVSVFGNLIEDEKFISIVSTTKTILIIISVTWFIIRFTNSIQRSLHKVKLETQFTVDLTTTGAISKLVKVSTLIISAILIIQTLGFSVKGILAFGGIGGLAIGFAAKDLLSNFFGALMIYFDKPFKVGDWVRSPDRNIEGIVEDIGWRQTIIRTFDKRPLYVPNSVFSTVAVENPSRMGNRRINEVIGLRYDDIGILKKIVSEVEEMLRKDVDIDTTQTLMVNFDKFSMYSVDFFIYTFTKTTVWEDFHEIKQRILFNVAEIIAKNGAEIAYPTRINIAAAAKEE